MTGADIVGSLLRGYAPLVAVIPAPLIKLGGLPEGSIGIVVRQTSSVDWHPLAHEAKVRVTDRVSVTVHAKSYREMAAAIGLVRLCCAGRTGDIGGAERVSILTAGRGPDLNGPGGIFEKTQDFRVSYLADA